MKDRTTKILQEAYDQVQQDTAFASLNANAKNLAPITYEDPFTGEVVKRQIVGLVNVPRQDMNTDADYYPASIELQGKVFLRAPNEANSTQRVAVFQPPRGLAMREGFLKTDKQSRDSVINLFNIAGIKLNPNSIQLFPDRGNNKWDGWTMNPSHRPDGSRRDGTTREI